MNLGPPLAPTWTGRFLRTLKTDHKRSDMTKTKERFALRLSLIHIEKFLFLLTRIRISMIQCPLW